MARVGQVGQRIGDRVHPVQACAAIGQAGEQAAVGGLVPCGLIRAVQVSLRQRRRQALRGLETEKPGQRRRAGVARITSRSTGELLGIQGQKRLDRVGQRVGPRFRGHLRRAGVGQGGIDHGDPRSQLVCHQRDLGRVSFPNENRAGGNLGTRSGGGRDRHQRQRRAGKPTVSDVIGRIAAVAQQDGQRLGQIEVASAPQSDHAIDSRTRAGHFRHDLTTEVQAGIGHSQVGHLTLQAGLVQRRDEIPRHRRLAREKAVRDQQGVPETQLREQGRQLAAGSPAV